MIGTFEWVLIGIAVTLLFGPKIWKRFLNMFIEVKKDTSEAILKFDDEENRKKNKIKAKKSI